MTIAVVGVGSNIEPDRFIPLAREKIERAGDVLGESTFIHTPAINRPDLADFRNGSWLVNTPLSKTVFTHELKTIEDECARVRCEDKFASRTLDLDLLVWDGEIVDDDYHTRKFLRDSVEELIPGFDK